MKGIPDHLDYNLKILFVGYNPGERSAITSYHYAGKNNQFYKLLYDSGLTPRLYLPEEDSSLLELGYGLTNIVSRPSKSSSDLSVKEMNEGGLILREKIIKYKPKIVAFLGKAVYRSFVGIKPSKPVNYGLCNRDESLEDPYLFLAPNPSGRSTIPYDDKLRLFKSLKELMTK